MDRNTLNIQGLFRALAIIALLAAALLLGVLFCPGYFSGPGRCLLLVIPVGVLILLSVALFAADRRYRKDRLLGYSNQELASEMLRTRAQISSLQSQINPHFLYNTLESIRSKALIHDEEEIATMIETLALLFRYNISRGDEAASISAELENVKNYIRIQNYRFRDKFIFKIDLDEIGDMMESYMLPPLTLQPIVENAIHHGLEKKIQQGTILIRGFFTQSKLIIQIRDDGVGIPPEAVDAIRERLQIFGGFSRISKDSCENVPHHGSGIALSNVNQRLKLFFGEEYGLDLTSAYGVGTQVELTLPAPADMKRPADAN